MSPGRNKSLNGNTHLVPEEAVPIVVPPENVTSMQIVEKTKLKKELGLMEGCAIIIGIIIGSGIFISPKGVLQNTGSVGLSIIVWVCCGILSMVGALCYAELGTTIPKSGGDYAYIHEAFGSLPSFLFLWDANFIFVPSTNAIMGLTFAKYVIQPFFPGCTMPASSERMIAAAAICLVTFFNCWNVRVTSKVQDVFMITKLGAMALVIIAGFVYIYQGQVENFQNSFVGTSSNPGDIAASFYSGIFSFAGWNFLNFMTEELKNPFKNLPRAIFISLPIVTILYVLINVAYLSVLSPGEILSSDAIAVTFSEKTFGSFKWMMPLLVAMSAFGGLLVHIMTSSRLCFVGARQGHFPNFLATINIKCNTPVPSLIFLGILSLAYLTTTDIFLLIEYCSFVESTFVLASIAALLYMKITRPCIQRPINIPIIVPALFLLVYGFIIFLPIYVRPFELGMGLAITATGIPAYFLFVENKKKPKIMQRILDSMTRLVQKLFLSVKEEMEY